MGAKIKILPLKKFLGLAIFLLILSASPSLYSEIQVYFNMTTHKIHKMSCSSGKACTRNCIIIPRSDAYSRGGVPCKRCGG